MRRILISIVSVAFCLAFAANVHAGQVTQPMNVSLTIGAAGGQVTLLVGSLVLTGPAPGPGTGSATVRVTATANLAYVITLDPGLHSPTGGGVRSLLASGCPAGGYCLLPYYLYSNPSLTQVWGNNDAVLGPGVSGIGTGSEQVYTAYAVTSSYQSGGATLPNGTYTDVVTVTVNF